VDRRGGPAPRAAEQGDLQGDHQDAHREGGHRVADPQRRGQHEDEQRAPLRRRELRRRPRNEHHRQGHPQAHQEQRRAPGLGDLERLAPGFSVQKDASRAPGGLW
jgi:hypothetical protein